MTPDEIRRRLLQMRAVVSTLQGDIDSLLALVQNQITAKTLDVPYLSQWDVPDADARPGDCGPACVVMLVHFLTPYRPTVDQVATVAGQPTTGAGRWYTNHVQLIRAANAYGVKLRTKRPLTIEMIESEVNAGRPVIALVNYGTLTVYGNQDTFIGAHWLAVVGHDDGHIYVNDSNFWGQRRDEGHQRQIPRPAFEAAMGTVSKTPGNSFDWQGLVVTGL